MKPIKGGVDRVTHMNMPKSDKYTDKISSTPKPYCNEDLGGDATNAIPGTSVRERVPPRPSQSRNQQPTRPIPRQGQSRADDDKFAPGAARRQNGY